MSGRMKTTSQRVRLTTAFGWKLGIGGAAGLLLTFMVLPLLALFVTLTWDEFASGMSHPLVVPALKLSIMTTSISLAIVVVFGVPLAWILSRYEGRVSRLVEVLVTLPVVLPPAVAGVALLLAFGNMGLTGQFFSRFGIQIPFTTAAVIVAEVFVAAPFFLQAATAAFRSIDDSLLVVARTLGASPARVLFRIALPMVAPSLVAGAAMTWARALGEFGATLMFAGNLTGETQTLTLAVYTTFESDMKAAQSISLVLVAVAFSLLFAVSKKMGQRMQKIESGH